ncbi:hypothetical protein Anapl_08668 [Anas platyrhynchos]|uniref:Uncharacterized protein n=1 Tax=Anas platyrhynchos TaxID=8839 RepID=R0K026_ANAPL|nr:hypothetical protein Anapl_08668 [Anas platyrhynchos]
MHQQALSGPEGSGFTGLDVSIAAATRKPAGCTQLYSAVLLQEKILIFKWHFWGCPGGYPETKLAAQAAGKPCEADGHLGLSRPAQFVCYRLSAVSASDDHILQCDVHLFKPHLLANSLQRPTENKFCNENTSHNVTSRLKERF